MRLLASLLFAVPILNSSAFDSAALPNKVVIKKMDQGLLNICNKGQLLEVETAVPGQSLFLHSYVYVDKSGPVTLWIQVSGSIQDFNRLLKIERPDGLDEEFAKQKWLRVFDRIMFATPDFVIADDSGRKVFEDLIKGADKSDWSLPHIPGPGEERSINKLLDGPTVIVQGNVWFLGYSLFNFDRSIIYRSAYGTLKPAVIAAASSYAMLDSRFWMTRQPNELNEVVRRSKILRERLVADARVLLDEAIPSEVYVLPYAN